MSAIAFFLLLNPAVTGSLPGGEVQNASLGGFTFFKGQENVVPGSDSNWNRNPSFQITRARGASRDSVLVLAMGSHSRTFSVAMSLERFKELRNYVGAYVTFTDWELDSRQVFVTKINRQGGRPFRNVVDIELIEQ